MTVWVVLSLVMIFIKGPIAFINDEVLDKRIDYSLFSHLFLLFQGIACRKFGMLSIDN